MNVLEQVKEALLDQMRNSANAHWVRPDGIARTDDDALAQRFGCPKAIEALAALEACEVVDGQAIGAPLLGLDPGNWRFHEGDRTEHFDRPAILLLEAEK